MFTAIFAGIKAKKNLLILALILSLVGSLATTVWLFKKESEARVTAELEAKQLLATKNDIELKLIAERQVFERVTNSDTTIQNKTEVIKKEIENVKDPVYDITPGDAAIILCEYQLATAEACEGTTTFSVIE